MKAIRITMPDGSRWEVPAHVVADDRARFYSEGEKSGDEGYREEFEYALEDDDGLLDWAANNMDWSDVVTCAKQAEPPPGVDYEEGWANGEKEIAEVDESHFPSSRGPEAT